MTQAKGIGEVGATVGQRRWRCYLWSAVIEETVGQDSVTDECLLFARGNLKSLTMAEGYCEPGFCEYHG